MSRFDEFVAWLARRTAISKRAEADRLWRQADQMRQRAIKLRIAANELDKETD